MWVWGWEGVEVCLCVCVWGGGGGGGMAPAAHMEQIWENSPLDPLTSQTTGGCVCLFVCVCVRVCAFLLLDVCIASAGVCPSVSECLSMTIMCNMRLLLFVCVPVCVCLCLCVYLCISVCMFV